MSHTRSSAILINLIILVLALTSIQSAPAAISNRFSPKRDGSALVDSRRPLASSGTRFRNLTGSLRDRLNPSQGAYDENDIADERLQETDVQHEKHSSTSEQISHVVVLTSLSGVYVWWPTLFGGDDSFHLLLSQEDVPRFHDVTGDEHGHIYLTAPHERTVYRLQYSNGWWISNFSNHSVMNSIRSEMPLFLNIHHVSSILYVYGHSDIQIIDLMERPRARGSAPFMKRLRELSPNLRISDMIIDQLTSDGYIIGDSYGWCTVIRCSLTVSECVFLFKIPSSYDNRPYPCTATIDFVTKIMYLSLEEKILAVHMNEQTNFDRRSVLTEKNGPRSTLGYDDIVTYNQTILYTDVLRPLLHICSATEGNRCLNMSLTFSSPQRTILPLRLSVIQAPHFRPPTFDEDDNDEAHERHIESPDGHFTPSALVAGNKTSTFSGLLADSTSMHSDAYLKTGYGGIWMLILGVFIGLLLAGLLFMIYYITWNKNRPKLKSQSQPGTSIASSIGRIIPTRTPSPRNGRMTGKALHSKLPTGNSSDLSSNHLLEYATSSSTTSSSVNTAITTSSSSYQPDIIL